MRASEFMSQVPLEISVEHRCFVKKRRPDIYNEWNVSIFGKKTGVKEKFRVYTGLSRPCFSPPDHDSIIFVLADDAREAEREMVSLRSCPSRVPSENTLIPCAKKMRKVLGKDYDKFLEVYTV